MIEEIKEESKEEYHLQNKKQVSFCIDNNEYFALEESIKELTIANEKPAQDKPKFRLNACRFLLTYKTHIDKNELILFFNKLCKIKKGENKPEIKFCRSGHEFGTNHESDKEDYEHTHTCIEFTKNFVSQDTEIFNFVTKDKEIIHPHMKYCGKTENKKWNDMKRYISKEDPENADLLLETLPLVDRVFNCETKYDVAKLCNKPGDIIGLLALHALKPIDNNKSLIYKELGGDKFNLYQWQNEVYQEMINMTGNTRKVTWIFDPMGNSGKSTFAKDLQSKDITYRVEGTGNGYENCAYLLGNAYKNKLWNGKNIIFDFPRGLNMMQSTSIYNMIEMLCNGEISIGKYQSEKITMKQNTQVYVFANKEPFFTVDGNPTLSFDRWKCLGVKSTKDGSDKVFSKKYYKETCHKINAMAKHFDQQTVISDDDEPMSLKRE